MSCDCVTTRARLRGCEVSCAGSSLIALHLLSEATLSQKLNTFFWQGGVWPLQSEWPPSTIACHVLGMGIPLIFWQSFPLLARLLAPVLTPTTHSPPEPFLPLNKFEVLASTKVIYQNNFTRGATFFRIFGRRKSETIKPFEIQNDSEVFVSPRKNNEYKLDLNISKFIIRLDCFFL